MSEPTPRVRSSKGRDKRFWNLQREITGMWMECIRHKRPISATHARICDMIKAADVTVTDRVRLHDANWASRNLVVCEHAKWILYIDGKVSTADERTEHYKVANCMERMSGRFEWSTGEPFYDDSPPETLGSKP